MNSKSLFAMRVSLALTVAGGIVASAFAAERVESPTSATSSVISYTAPSGESYFALSLKPGALESGRSIAHDHVLLVDTSASQMGEHRTQALRVAEAFVASLDPADRVLLMAVDVQAKALTEGFVSSRSEALETAFGQLKRRIPLGATNLEPALTLALDSFEGDRPRSIVYIGDGMSTARLIQSPNMRALITALREDRVPVHSYAVGPNTDLMLLGVLAQHTGGTVSIDDRQIVDGKPQLPNPENVGRKLAAAATAPVFYSTELQTEPALEQLLPQQLPPLRSDRETILLGKGPVPATIRVTVGGDVRSEARSLEWTAARQPEQPGNVFLAALWARAHQDDGLSVPVAGATMLNAAREAHVRQIQNLETLAEQALNLHQVKEAENIAVNLQQLDPANRQAKRVLQQARAGASAPVRNAIGNGTPKARQIALNQAPADDADDAQPAPPPLPPVPPAPANGADAVDDFVEQPPRLPADAADDLLQRREALVQVRTEQMRLEVSNAIEAIRRMAEQDPDIALDDLKRQRNAVVTATDIDPEVRARLLARLDNLRLEITSRREVLDLARINLQRQQALLESRRRLLDQMQLEEERMENLIDRVRSLMSAGYHGDSDAFEEAEAVARAAIEVSPNGIEPTAALFNAEAAGQLDKAFRLRALRADKFLEALYQVELSHVPFPDEPPILWPAPEVWQALTERRRKWASVDLKTYNPIEERIRAALDEPTEIEFIELPLQDALNYIKDYHKIEIQMMKADLEQEGVATDTLITLTLSGVSLRSALKLMFEGHGLPVRYVIEDEVLKITTETYAGQARSTRVYPVGDLVIPITSAGLGMGVGGLTGAAGLGTGLGGFGGGMMGGGMGMGGFGGGMFNVAPEKIPANAVPAKPGADVPAAAPNAAQRGRNARQPLAQGAAPAKEQPRAFNNETLRNHKKKLSADR